MYVALIVMTQLSMLVLILLVYKNKSLNKSGKTGLIITSVLIMAGALFECLGELLNGLGPEFYVLHNIIKFFELSVAPIIPIVISTAFYPIKSRHLVFIPNAIHIVLEFLSLFYGFIFNIDENNIYTHGKFYFIYYTVFLGNISYSYGC